MACAVVVYARMNSLTLDWCNTPMNLPVACTLSPETLAALRAGLLPAFALEAETREQAPDGLRLRFSASTERLQRIAAVIDAERQCCRFCASTLRWNPTAAPCG